MDVEINGMRPLDYMIPKFLTLTDHPSSKMRSHAVACLSYFVPANCQSLFVHLDAFIAALFRRASNDDNTMAHFSTRRPCIRRAWVETTLGFVGFEDEG